MQAITDEHKKVYLIAETDEKYKTFTLDDKFSFYDSMQHLIASLSSLAENLDSQQKSEIKSLDITKKDYPITSKYFEDPSMIGKGVYPYEYVDCWSRFEEESLPPRECFYSTLTKKRYNR